MSTLAGIWHSFRREFLLPRRTPRVARAVPPRPVPSMRQRLVALARHWKGLVLRWGWIHCDFPSPASPEPPTLRGVVEMSGWALAADGEVVSVAVACGGEAIGDASLGRRRPDVARAFPHLPAARRSGFVFRLDTRHLAPGSHRLTLCARTDAGRSLRLEAPFRIDNDLSPFERWRQQTTPNAAALDWMRRHSGKLTARPRFSVLVAVLSEAAAAALAATAESVRDQVYPAWELVVACERRYLTAAERSLGRDPGGRFRTESGLFADRADALDQALRAATGEWFLRLEPGDEVTPDTLFEAAYLLCRRPGVDLLYADEEVRAAPACAPNPLFKPGWSPELLRGVNYLGRAWAARTELLRDEGFAGGPDGHGFALRLAGRAREVAHLPAVLLRRAPGPAENADEPASASAEAADLPAPPGEAWGVSIILDGGDATAAVRFLESLAASGVPGGCDLLLAAASREAEARCLALGGRLVPFDTAGNAAERLNRAAAAARGEYLLFVRAAGVVATDWVGALCGLASRPGVGVVGGHLLDADGRARSAGLVLTDEDRLLAHASAGPGGPAASFLFGAARECMAVSRDCLLVRRTLFHELGGFDERLDGELVEADFCLHARREGHSVLVTPAAALRHAGTPSDPSSPAAREVYRARWGDAHERGDPYFPPNLVPHPSGPRVNDTPLTLTHAPCPRIDAASVRRVLAVKLDHLGDVSLALPAVRRLRALFPAAELTVLVGPWARQLAEAEPGVDRVLTYEFFRAESSRPPRPPAGAEKERVAAWLASHRFDLAVDLRREFDTREFLRLSGARYTAGFAEPLQGGWLTVAVPCEGVIRRWTPRRHMSQDALRLVELVGQACRAVETLPPAGASGRREVAALLAGVLPPDAPLLVGMHPGSGRPLKLWPAESFGRLAGMFAERLGAAVAVFGGPGEVELAATAVRHAGAGGRVASLAGRLDVAGLRSALGCCDLFVGNDSGPTHLAAAAGVPTLGVYVATVDPLQWGPLGSEAATVMRPPPCSPCYHGRPRDCAYGRECARRLGPERVWEAAFRLLLPRWHKLPAGAMGTVPGAAGDRIVPAVGG